MNISRRAIGPAVVIVLLFVGMLVYSAPARLMQPILQSALPQLGVTGLQGSLWRGSATQSWVTHQNKRLALGKFSWHLKPWSLLLLAPRVDVQLQGAGLHAQGELVTSVFGGVGAEDVIANFPLSVFRTWYPLLLGGQLNLRVSSVAFQDNWFVDLSADAILESASWRMGRNIISLGDYQGQFSLESAQLVAELRDRDAPMSLLGGATLAADGSYSTNLYVQLRDSQAADIAPIYRFMEFVGKSEGDGLRIKIDSKLPGMRVSP